jgi:putative DNA primase/helicase
MDLTRSIPGAGGASDGRLIVEALGGHWTLNGGMCRCPAHADSTPSLSVRPGAKRLLYHCFAGCETKQVLAALSRLNLPAGGSLPAEFQALDGGRGTLRAAAVRLWSEARPLSDSLGDSYLAIRGISERSSELRFHPRTPHGRKPFTRFAPALIAAVRDDSGLVGVHRTFLDRTTKRLATLAPAKCALGRLGSGAVRLQPAGDVLGMAEGIETALSAAQLFGIPCWAALGTERFRHVALPTSVSMLLLFLDRDGGGRRAEALVRSRLGEQVAIEARYPPRNGDDWNDVLAREAARSSARQGREERAAGRS